MPGLGFGVRSAMQVIDTVANPTLKILGGSFGAGPTHGLADNTFKVVFLSAVFALRQMFLELFEVLAAQRVVQVLIDSGESLLAGCGGAICAGCSGHEGSFLKPRF